MPTTATEQSLRIEKLVYGGDGLAHVEGRVVLTPFVLPGEMVRVEVRRVKNDLLRGRLLEVLEPAAERVEPRCPYFLRCGGCHYQQGSYELEADQKREILREVLRRVGRIDYLGEIGLVTAAPWQYRNRTQLHIRDGEIGYFAPASHTLVAIRECPISSPKLNEVIALLAGDLPGYREFTGSVELFTNETEVQVNLLDRIPAQVRPLFDLIGTSEPIEYDGFRVSRNSFFQVNRFLVEKLVASVLGDAQGSSALDLYAGVGLFAKSLAERFQQVVAVETSGGAFRDLAFNMERAEVGVIPIQISAEEYLGAMASPPELIVADPPRAGLGKKALQELVRVQAPRIVLVSCDPATLARDLAHLLESGYRIHGLTLVDLFPRTFHLETVVSLRRK